MMPTNRPLRLVRLATAAFALCLTTAHAVELLQPVVFPDDGRESDARGLLVGDRRAYAAAPSVVFGRKRDVGGVWQPYVWELDADGQLVAAHPLGLLPGFTEGSALGGCQFANGDRVAAGTVGTPGTLGERTVLWRQLSAGAWGPAIDFDPGDVSSSPSGLDGKGTDVNVEEIELVISRIFPDDTMRLTVAGVDETTVGSVDLQLPPGATAAALGIAFDAAQNTVVGGWTAGADGRRVPTLWRQDGAFLPIPLALPKRFAGELHALATRGGGFLGVGEATATGAAPQGLLLEIARDAAGRTRARRRVFLPPLAGAVHSTAIAVIGSEHLLPGVIGASVDAGGDALPTVWLPNGKRRWTPIAATQLLSDPAFTGLTDLRHSSYGFVGRVVPAVGHAAQGAFLRRTGTRVPDGVTVLAGQPAGGRGLSNAIALWHADGRSLVVAAKRDGTSRYANQEIAYVVPPYAGMLSVDYRIVAALHEAGPGVTGTLDVTVWDRQAETFVTVASHAVDANGATLTGSLVGDGARFIDPVAGVLRARLVFRAATTAPVAIALDEASIEASAGAGW